jgi:hypothetical protein
MTPFVDIDVSVLVPLNERPMSPAVLYSEYSAPLRSAGLSYEFVFIAGPARSGTARVARELAAAGEPVVVLELAHTTGDAAMVKLAAAQSRGAMVVTLPAYHRIEPGGLPELLARVAEGSDAAVARRWPRVDAPVNQLQNRALHWLLHGLLGGAVRDIACGVIAMRPQVLRDLPLYGDFFRFLPLFAIRHGYNVVEVDVAQHPGDRQPRVYSPGTYLRRLLDLLLVFFLLRFTEKPLRFFGMFGAGLGGAGGLVLAVIGVQRVLGQPLADRPVLLAGLLLVIVGIQAIALGLIGEIIVHLQASQRRPYRVRQESPPLPLRAGRAASPAAVASRVEEPPVPA